MPDQELTQYLQQHGFKVMNDIALKKIDNFHVKLLLKKVVSGIVSFYGSENESIKELESFFEKAKTDGEVISIEWLCENKMVEFSFVENENDKIMMFIEKLVSEARKNGLVDGCEICESTSDISFAKKDTSVIKVCNNCMELNNNPIKTGNSWPNIVTGAIGALLGALLGSILWMIIGAFGIYASIAGFVIAFMAVQGYRLFKGPALTVSVLIIGLSVLYAVIQAELFGLAFDVIKIFKEEKAIDLSFTQALRVTMMMLKENEIIAELIPNLLMGLGFAALGSFRLLSGILKANKPVVMEKIELDGNKII